MDEDQTCISSIVFDGETDATQILMLAAIGKVASQLIQAGHPALSLNKNKIPTLSVGTG